MTDSIISSDKVCANCGSSRSTPFCGQCGQNERGSVRLRSRDLAVNCANALLDVESPLPATLIGLIRNPGRVCLAYVFGQRKRYMNPFAFLLVAVAIQFILAAVLRWTGLVATPPVESDAFPDDAMNLILFSMVVPLAFLWTRLFLSSGRNFAENYVLGLYLIGQFAWLELLLMLLTFFAQLETLLSMAFPFIWLTMATWAGTVFYSMPWYSVFWRMLTSTAAAIAIFGGILFGVMEVVSWFSPWEIKR